MTWKCNVYGSSTVHYLRKCTWWPLTSITSKCPNRQIAEQVKKCSGDIGLSENNSAENSPWGRGAIASSKSIFGNIQIIPQSVLNSEKCSGHTTLVNPTLLFNRTACELSPQISAFLWLHYQLLSAEGPFQFRLPFSGTVTLHISHQHHRSRFSGSVLRLFSSGTTMLT